MPFREIGSIRYYYFDIFQETRIVHCVFTRSGGVSPKPWKSLNVGGTVGDQQANVLENRKRIFNAVNHPVETIFDVWQVHSVNIICTESPRPLEAHHKKADVIITDRNNITLFMRFADCVPILFFDPIHHVIGIAHAGWQGTLNRICERTVHTMKSRYNSCPNDIMAGIGPSIGPDHYQIGPEVVEKVYQAFGKDSSELLLQYNGKDYFNLWEANRLILSQAGVKNIQVAEICTACHLEDWYSHRGENGTTGRFGALIAQP